MKLKTMNTMKNSLGYLVAISMGLMAFPGISYSTGESPACPNIGSGPPCGCPQGPPPPGGPPPPPPPPGGPPPPPPGRPLPPGGGGGKGNPSYVGDPINISTGTSLSMDIDVSIPVKYGLSLDIGRRYSSEVYDTLNSDGDTMFGPHWHGSYEMRLNPYQYGDPVADFYSFLDSDGSMCDFTYMFSEYDADFGANVKVFRSFAQQGVPKELRFKVTNPDQYVITRSNHSQAIFDSDLKLIALEANKDTVAQERITFVYDTNDRMIEIHSPSGDDRYLEIEYHDDTQNDVIDQVKTVSLVTSTSTIDLVEYGYLPNSRLLSYMERPEANNDYRVIYEYGSYDGTELIPVTGYEYLLGCVSYRSDSQTYPLNAYGYADFSMYWGGSTKKAYKTYNYDPDNSQWVNTIEVDYNSDWYNLEVIYPCDLPDQPKSLDTLDWQHDILVRSYENLDSYESPVASAFSSQMKNVRKGGAEDYPAAAPPRKPEYPTVMAKVEMQSPDGADTTEGITPRMRSGVNLYDPNTQDYTIQPSVTGFDLADPYSATDSKYLYQFYKTSETKYPTTDASSALTTDYEYSTTFPYRVTSITNPENGEAAYTYDTNTSNTASYGRLTSTLSPGGESTSYSYNSSGLLETVTDNNSNDVDFTYNSRGQITRTEYGNGLSLTTTYNDFGQVLSLVDEVTSETTTYTLSDQLQTTDPQYHVPPRLIEITDDSNNERTFEYNDWGQIVSITDENNIEATKTYDARGRMISNTNGAGDVFKYEYDVFDRLVKFIDGNFSSLDESQQKYTEYKRDIFGRIVATFDPDGNATYYEFTGDNGSCSSCVSGSDSGSISHVERPEIGTSDKEHLFLKYDLMGRKTHGSYSTTNTPPTDWSTADILITYSDLGKLETVTDNRLTLAGDKTYHYSYESGTGRLLKVIHPEGYSNEYIYDSNGELIAYRDADGHVVEYTFDSKGRLDTLTDTYGGVTDWDFYDETQSTQPVGALKKVVRSNYTFDEYLYDSLGRLDRINYRMTEYTQTTLDYVDLTLDDTGLITNKDRGGVYNVEYTYDDAKHLTGEIYNNSSDVEQFRRAYTYDDAGNRATMAFGGKTTSYSYGDQNEMVSNTGFARFGSVDTGPMTFQHDVRGNMKYQSGISYSWNEDNRLTQVYISEGDPKGGSHTVNYRYDTMGQRILKHVNTGQRTRFFSNGLTEEIKKVSVGTHNDSAFGFVSKLDAEGSDGGVSGFNAPATMSISDDADRYSSVYTCSSWSSHGKGYWDDTTDGWNISGKRTASFWAKSATTNSEVAIHVKCTDGTKIGLYYKTGTGTNYKDSNNPAAFFYLGNGSAQYSYLNKWSRVERDLQDDIFTFWPGKTIAKVTGCSVGNVSLDDMRFSNSLTVEHNVVGPGVIGQILRHCTINPVGYARTDNWFHYDHVGSVVAESSSSTIPSITRIYSDAWGNRMSNWTTGEWTSTWASRDGWGHNTKNYDGDSGLIYMYQRWYQPELGTFLSQAPMPVQMEHAYTFASSSPVNGLDVLGMKDQKPTREEAFKHCTDVAKRDRDQALTNARIHNLDTQVGIIASYVIAFAACLLFPPITVACVAVATVALAVAMAIAHTSYLQETIEINQQYMNAVDDCWWDYENSCDGGDETIA
jgi:RHS repeat-associated protein